MLRSNVMSAPEAYSKDSGMVGSLNSTALSSLQQKSSIICRFLQLTPPAIVAINIAVSDVQIEANNMVLEVLAEENDKLSKILAV